MGWGCTIHTMSKPPGPQLPSLVVRKNSGQPLQLDGKPQRAERTTTTTALACVAPAIVIGQCAGTAIIRRSASPRIPRSGHFDCNGDSMTVYPSRCRLHLLLTAYVHRKVIVVPVASFRMPAPLRAELEHRSMIETIVNLCGRPTWDIVSVG